MRASSCRSTRWSASACSDSCPGLFSQLKEVYLFGCNTLNAERGRARPPRSGAASSASGHSPADAERLARELDERHGESNRDRMRRIFKDVPVIYGFSAKAPLGPMAAPVLDRYFQSGAGGEIGSGRASREAARPLCAQLDDGRQRHERCGSAGGLSAGRVPFLRRSPVAGAEARLRPSASQARHGGSADVSGSHRTLFGLAERTGAAIAGCCAGVRRDRARSRRHAPGTWTLHATPTNPRCAPA